MSAAAHGVPVAESAGVSRPKNGNAGGGGRPVAGLGQGMAQGADNQAPHKRGIAEPHLGFRRVHVDVEPIRADVQKQRQHGVAVARQQILVGAAHSPQQQTIAHRAAVDEEVLGLGIAAVQRLHAGVAGQAHGFALGVHFQGVIGEFPAHDLAQPGQTGGEQVAGAGAIAEHRALAVGQGKGDVGKGHGHPFDGVGGVVQFRAGLLQEF